MPAETPTAEKAAADAAASEKALEGKRAEAAAKAQKKADDQAKAEAHAKEEAEKAAADTAASEAATSESNPITEQKDRAKRAAEFRASAGRIYMAFMSPEIGLSSVSASILAAHCMSALDKPEHMGGTEAIAWAKGFRQAHPIVWSALRIGHLMNFAASMRRAGNDTASPDELGQAASVIRG